MSERSVFIRHDGWIDKIQIESESNGVLKTVRNERGFEAECWPKGAATISRYRDGVLVYEGFGVWSDTEIKAQSQTPSGPTIEIRRGMRIWSVEHERWRMLDRSIRVSIAGETDEGEYTFDYDGQVWAIGVEHI